MNFAYLLSMASSQGGAAAAQQGSAGSSIIMIVFFVFIIGYFAVIMRKDKKQQQSKKEKQFGDLVFREGDRVMQIRNNYDVLWHNKDFTVCGSGMFNGDIGYIQFIDMNSEMLEIDFDGRIASYPFSSLNELEHAWAITVHKSQGCEFRAVILALSSSSKLLLTRGVLYTGVTRAKELLILIGDEEVACRMVDNAKRSNRYSFLRTRIMQNIGV